MKIVFLITTLLILSSFSVEARAWGPPKLTLVFSDADNHAITATISGEKPMGGWCNWYYNDVDYIVNYESKQPYCYFEFPPLDIYEQENFSIVINKYAQYEKTFSSGMYQDGTQYLTIDQDSFNSSDIEVLDSGIILIPSFPIRDNSEPIVLYIDLENITLTDVQNLGVASMFEEGREPISIDKEPYVKYLNQHYQKPQFYNSYVIGSLVLLVVIVTFFWLKKIL